jgi:REP element-mobilizing transposase RayT
MRYDPTRHHRRSVRLKGYDYTQAGAYFVTIVTQDRACLFGEVVDGAMRLNEYGEIIRDEWVKSATLRPRVTLDEFAVMPNHIHGIITLADSNRQDTWAGRGTLQRAPTVEQSGKPTSDSVPTIIRLFKAATTKRINDLRGTPGTSVWQRNYYEHIIRDDKSLNRIRQYIRDNPLRWAFDRENPESVHPEPEDAWHT